MITWYIIGNIMFVLQVYILKHTYYVEVRGKKYENSLEKLLQPVKTPMFVIVLMALCTIIPYVWVISTFAFWGVWIKKYNNPEGGACSYNSYTYWRLRDNILMKSI